MNEPLYGIVFADTLELVSPAVIKKHWPNYGSNSLYGWKPPKRIYDTVGKAKAGFAHLPNEIKDKLAIVSFMPSRLGAIKGADLVKEYQDRQLKKEQAKLRKSAKRRQAEAARLEAEAADLLKRATKLKAK